MDGQFCHTQENACWDTKQSELSEGLGKYESFHAGVSSPLADAPFTSARGRGRAAAQVIPHQPAYAASPSHDLEGVTMMMQRFFDYDMREYSRGYYFNFLGLVRVLKLKTNTVMQKDDWIFIIEIFGREYILS
jgi:hypothetical protein